MLNELVYESDGKNEETNNYVTLTGANKIVRKEELCTQINDIIKRPRTGEIHHKLSIKKALARYERENLCSLGDRLSTTVEIDPRELHLG